MPGRRNPDSDSGVPAEDFNASLVEALQNQQSVVDDAFSSGTINQAEYSGYSSEIQYALEDALGTASTRPTGYGVGDAIGGALNAFSGPAALVTSGVRTLLPGEAGIDSGKEFLDSVDVSSGNFGSPGNLIRNSDIDNGAVRFTAGLGADILTDPTNWIGVGLVDDAGRVAATHVARDVLAGRALERGLGDDVVQKVLQRGWRGLSVADREALDFSRYVKVPFLPKKTAVTIGDFASPFKGLRTYGTGRIGSRAVARIEAKGGFDAAKGSWLTAGFFGNRYQIARAAMAESPAVTKEMFEAVYASGATRGAYHSIAGGIRQLFGDSDAEFSSLPATMKDELRGAATGGVKHGPVYDSVIAQVDDSIEAAIKEKSGQSVPQIINEVSATFAGKTVTVDGVEYAMAPLVKAYTHALMTFSIGSDGAVVTASRMMREGLNWFDGSKMNASNWFVGKSVAKYGAGVGRINDFLRGLDLAVADAAKLINGRAELEATMLDGIDNMFMTDDAMAILNDILHQRGLLPEGVHLQSLPSSHGSYMAAFDGYYNDFRAAWQTADETLSRLKVALGMDDVSTIDDLVERLGAQARSFKGKELNAIKNSKREFTKVEAVFMRWRAKTRALGISNTEAVEMIRYVDSQRRMIEAFQDGIMRRVRDGVGGLDRQLQREIRAGIHGGVRPPKMSVADVRKNVRALIKTALDSGVYEPADDFYVVMRLAGADDATLRVVVAAEMEVLDRALVQLASGQTWLERVVEARQNSAALRGVAQDAADESARLTALQNESVAGVAAMIETDKAHMILGGIGFDPDAIGEFEFNAALVRQLFILGSDLGVSVPDQVLATANRKIEAAIADIGKRILGVDDAGVIKYMNGTPATVKRPVAIGNGLVAGDSPLVGQLMFALKPITQAELRQVGGILANVNSWWKSMAILSPGFSIRNFMGGMMNNVRDGMQGSSIRDWFRYQEFARVGRMAEIVGDSDMAARAWGQIPSDLRAPFRRIANDAGFSDIGKIEDYAQDVKSFWAEKGRKLDSGIASLIGISGKRVLGGSDMSVEMRAFMKMHSAKLPPTEWHLRGMLALDTMKRGDTFNTALMRVNRVHFDYQDISPRLAQLKSTIAPFITWKVGNTPLQMEYLLSGDVGVKTEMIASVQSRDYSPTYTPDYLIGGTGTFFQVGGQSLQWTNQASPFNDLVDMTDQFTRTYQEEGFGAAAFRLGLEQASPAVTLLAEYQTGRSVATGIPLGPDGGDGLVKASWSKVPLLSGVLGRVLEATGNAQKDEFGDWVLPAKIDYAITEGLPILSQMSRLTNSRQGDPEKGGDPRSDRNLLYAWMSYMGFGIVEIKDENRVRQIKKETALLIKEMKESGLAS